MFKKYSFWFLVVSFSTSVAASEGCPPQLRTYHFYDRSGQALSCMDQWQAEFFLGACSDPAMQWQLLLQLHNSQGGSRRVAQILQSSWR